MYTLACCRVIRARGREAERAIQARTPRSCELSRVSTPVSLMLQLLDGQGKAVGRQAAHDILVQCTCGDRDADPDR